MLWDKIVPPSLSFLTGYGFLKLLMWAISTPLNQLDLARVAEPSDEFSLLMFDGKVVQPIGVPAKKCFTSQFAFHT